MIQILVVDDHRLVCEGTKNMLEKESDFQVEVATSGTETRKLMEKRIYDLFLLDWSMPDISGIELSKFILRNQSNAKIVIYTEFDVIPVINHLLESGITGFVSKTVTREQLVTVIRCALRDEAVIPVNILRQLHCCEVKAKFEESEEHIVLSHIEQEILLDVANGTRNKDIAKKHFISQRSVERHLSRIFSKLNVSSRIEAVEKARQVGIIPGLNLLK